jgi:hypothetical protein
VLNILPVLKVSFTGDHSVVLVLLKQVSHLNLDFIVLVFPKALRNKESVALLARLLTFVNYDKQEVICSFGHFGHLFKFRRPLKWST